MLSRSIVVGQIGARVRLIQGVRCTTSKRCSGSLEEEMDLPCCMLRGDGGRGGSPGEGLLTREGSEFS
jgi:hypothetical protein